MNRRKTLISRCLEKQHRNNLYNDLESAERAAITMTQKVGHLISAFQCPICKKYHIGRPNYSCDIKESFNTEEEAKKRTVEIRKEELMLMRPTYCKKCDRWHLIGG